MWYFLVCVFAIATFLLGAKTPRPIKGIYSQPGTFYPIKFVAFYLLLTLRKVN